MTAEWTSRRVHSADFLLPALVPLSVAGPLNRTVCIGETLARRTVIAIHTAPCLRASRGCNRQPVVSVEAQALCVVE